MYLQAMLAWCWFSSCGSGEVVNCLPLAHSKLYMLRHKPKKHFVALAQLLSALVMAVLLGGLYALDRNLHNESGVGWFVAVA